MCGEAMHFCMCSTPEGGRGWRLFGTEQIFLSPLSAPPFHDTGEFPVAKTSFRLCLAASQKAAFALVTGASAIRNADTQKSLESSARPTNNDLVLLSSPHPSSNFVSLSDQVVQCIVRNCDALNDAAVFVRRRRQARRKCSDATSFTWSRVPRCA